jgi:hypothetical protein
MDAELERFKTEINLSAYAAVEGYCLLKNESSKNSVAMKHPSGDKIIITRGHDNHWIYCSVRDDRDNGSIIDFVQNREKCSLGTVRSILRRWTGSGAPSPAPNLFAANVQKSSKDRQSVLAALARMPNATEHPYLKNQRAIGKEITGDRRFLGRIKMDTKGNAIFPHYDEEGTCGYEIKNKGFTGFSAGGDKGLWVSRCFAGDESLVIAESAIDALSFHALHKWKTARYVSTAGGWSPQTRTLLFKAVQEFSGAKVVLAYDNDDQGKVYEAETRDLLSGCEKVILSMYSESKDWNEDLKGSVSPSLLPDKHEP